MQDETIKNLQKFTFTMIQHAAHDDKPKPADEGSKTTEEKTKPIDSKSKPTSEKLTTAKSANLPEKFTATIPVSDEFFNLFQTVNQPFCVNIFLIHLRSAI